MAETAKKNLLAELGKVGVEVSTAGQKEGAARQKKVAAINLAKEQDIKKEQLKENLRKLIKELMRFYTEGSEIAARTKNAETEKSLQTYLNSLIAMAEAKKAILRSKTTEELAKAIIMAANLTRKALEDGNVTYKIAEKNGYKEAMDFLSKSLNHLNEFESMLPELYRVFVFNNNSQDVFVQEQQFNKFYTGYLLPSLLSQQLASAESLDKLVNKLLDKRNKAIECSLEGKVSDEEKRYIVENNLQPWIRLYSNLDPSKELLGGVAVLASGKLLFPESIPHQTIG
ncbi:MAG: hypothetical protein N3G76_01145 [Candidatus Micrarchaeota archaeon]|nr:hypothetical protein [Candidatus Micrarchaeota archaeon]